MVLRCFCLCLLFFSVSLCSARPQWFFLPNYRHDIRGIEAVPQDASRLFSTLPKPAEALLKPEAQLSAVQRKNLHWHPVTFPHQDFVKLMPERGVFGWYGSIFEVPIELQDYDLLVDMGIIDDTDASFINGQQIGGTGIIGKSHGSAWQTERLYRIPANSLTATQNYLAVHVWNLWGLGGIVGPPVLKTAIAPSNSHWDIAFVKDVRIPTGNLNNAQTVDLALSIVSKNNELEWLKAPIPWNGFAEWKEDTHYAIFRLKFDMFCKDGSPHCLQQLVVLDVGSVFDVASFYLNGKRIGLTGRFLEGKECAFTEAAQRGQFIVKPEIWAKDGHNELIAVVFREHGVGGLPGIPGILLGNPLDNNNNHHSYADASILFNIYVQSGMLSEADTLLSKVKAASKTEHAWLLSHRTHLAFLKWLDGGKRNNVLIDAIISPIKDILSQYPTEAPKQSAMQAFCKILRFAEKDSDIMSIVKKYFPLFSEGCAAKPPDRNTKGDWMLHYGEYFHVLAAMGQTADWTGGKGQCKYRLFVPGKKDVPRYWLPASQRKLLNPSALIMHIPFTEAARTIDRISIEDMSPFLFSKHPIRRSSWWDDHGEMHPFDDEGPDLTMHISSIPDDCQISLFFLDYDWKSTIHPRQQSMLAFDASGNFLNAIWSGKTNEGVYEGFMLLRQQAITLRFLKHRGACIAVSGIFVDKFPVLPDIPPKMHGEVAEDILELYNSLRQARNGERVQCAQHIMNEWNRLIKTECAIKGLFILAMALECGEPNRELLNILQKSLWHIGSTTDILDWLDVIRNIDNITPVWYYTAAACLFETLPAISREEADESLYRLFLMCDNRFLLPIRRICLNALKESTRTDAIEKVKLMNHLLPERFRDEL